MKNIFSLKEAILFLSSQPGYIYVCTQAEPLETRMIFRAVRQMTPGQKRVWTAGAGVLGFGAVVKVSLCTKWWRNNIRCMECEMVVLFQQDYLPLKSP